MSPRFATPVPPAGIALGILTLAVTGADAGVAAPEWIKITPKGQIKTRDGRPYTFDPATLVARFKKDDVDIPIDVDHAIARKAAQGEKADAHGWIKSLAAREDGLYGRVDWLDNGKAVLAARTHRYISPTFHHDDSGNATWLHSVALVSAPALSMPAVADAGAHSEPEIAMLKAIAKALGLAETADEAACLAAINKLNTEPIATALGITEAADAAACAAAVEQLKASTVSKAVYDQAVANLGAAEKKLSDIATAERRTKVTALIEGALKDKKILPAQKEHYAALCASDQGIADVEKLLAATPAGLQASGLDDKKPSDVDTADPVALAAAATAHQKKLAEAGQTISYAEAVVAVSAKEEKK